MLPPNPNQWNYEHAGLDVRDQLGLGIEEALDPAHAFKLLPNAAVHPHGAIPAAAKFIAHFRRQGSSSWSGMALTDDDGYHLVFYNDSHPPNRVRATLMEEFFHIRFEHQRSRIRVLHSNDKGRTFESATEEEAYHSGAAALVPYGQLVKMLADGTPAWQIAKHFDVSKDLVIFRAKVTKCYGRLRRRRS